MKFYEKAGIKEIIGKSDWDLPMDISFVGKYNNGDKMVLKTKRTLEIEENLGNSVFKTIKTPIVDSDGDVLGLVGIVKDITCDKAKENIKNHLFYKYDPTVLYNRTYFYEKVD